MSSEARGFAVMGAMIALLVVHAFAGYTWAIYIPSVVYTTLSIIVIPFLPGITYFLTKNIDDLMTVPANPTANDLIRSAEVRMSLLKAARADDSLTFLGILKLAGWAFIVGYFAAHAFYVTVGLMLTAMLVGKVAMHYLKKTVIDANIRSLAEMPLDTVE